MLRPLITASTVPIVVKPFANISPATTSVTTLANCVPMPSKTPAHRPLFRASYACGRTQQTSSPSNSVTSPPPDAVLTASARRGQGTASRASGLTASPVKWRNRAAGHYRELLLCLFVIDMFIFFVESALHEKVEIATEIMTQEATGSW